MKLSGSRLFAEAMRAYGVSHVFFVPDVLVPALAEMEDMGITRVMTHGEKSAAYMADGYARVARKPGVCMAQTVGAANLAAGLKDAYLACAPVIALTGGRKPESKHRHVYQELEDFAMFAPVTKLNLELDVAAQFGDVLRQAFRVATTGCPGPVHLELAGHGGNVVETEIDVPLTFEPQFAATPVFRPHAEPAHVQRALAALGSAERPVIVAGGGVALSDAGAELTALAEKLGIPVATSLNAKGSVPENHPLSVGVVGTYSRWCANRVVAEADLVFFIGSHTGSQVTTNFAIPSQGTRVIQLDIDPVELGRTYPNEVSLLGDARTVLRQMLEASEPAPPRSGWRERTAQLVQQWRSDWEPLATSDAVPMRPERVCRDLTAALPADAIVVSDTGHAGIWCATAIDLTWPRQRFLRAAGSLGWGFPAALGAKCAAPDQPVVCFTGDGGFYYHIAELETAVRFGINAVIVVNNNQSLNQELPHFDRVYQGNQRGGARKMWTFEPINFAKVAEAFGCVGLRVERPADLRDAFQEGLRANRPVVIDVVTAEEALGPTAWRPGMATPERSPALAGAH